MYKKINICSRISVLLITLFLSFSTFAFNEDKPQLIIQMELPKLKVNPYHKPYVAIWLETLERKYVTTIKLLADDPEWHKDLRQWWRKVSRENINIDGVTGATKRPGLVTVNWLGNNELQQPIPAGEYFINIEVAREEGGRDYVRKKITLGKDTQLLIQGKTEFGNININASTLNY